MAKIQLPKKFISKYPTSSQGKQQFLCGKRILPKPITGKESLPDLMDQVFLAYNGGPSAGGLSAVHERMLQPEVTMGMSLAGP